MAEKSKEEQRKHAFTVVAIVGGGGLLLIVLARSSGATGRGPAQATGRATPARGTSTVAPHTLNFGPNPAQPQVDEAIIAARANALQTYDQSAVAELGIRGQYALGINQDQTAQAISANTNATQLKETGMTTAAQQAIAEAETAAQTQMAQIQAQAYEQVGGQYASAQQTQASGNMWTGILGAIGSFIPFLGSL